MQVEEAVSAERPAAAAADGKPGAGASARRRASNPAYWYCVLGALVLAATFWIPLVTAQRTARVEERGDRLAELLLAEGAAAAPLDWDDPAVRAFLHARLLLAGAATGIYVADLEVVEPQPAPEAFTLRNKHYVIQLRPAPPAGEGSREGSGRDDGRRAPLEALAWPLAAAGPGHAVFFHPEDAERAYTRNLQAGYHGLDPADWPGRGRAHRRADARRSWDYRDFDDERWLLHDRPGSPGAR